MKPNVLGTCMKQEVRARLGKFLPDRCLRGVTMWLVGRDFSMFSRKSRCSAWRVDGQGPGPEGPEMSVFQRALVVEWGGNGCG